VKKSLLATSSRVAFGTNFAPLIGRMIRRTLYLLVIGKESPSGWNPYKGRSQRRDECAYATLSTERNSLTVEPDSTLVFISCVELTTCRFAVKPHSFTHHRPCGLRPASLSLLRQVAFKSFTVAANCLSVARRSSVQLSPCKTVPWSRKNSSPI